MEKDKRAANNERVRIKRIDFKEQIPLKEIAEEIGISYSKAYNRIRYVKGVKVYDFYGVIIVDRANFMEFWNNKREYNKKSN